MDFTVQRVVQEGGEHWQVRAGSMLFSFTCQTSALTFAAKLKDRIEAPHRLPDERRLPEDQQMAIEV